MIHRVIAGTYETKCDRCGQTDEFKAGSRDHARRRFLDHGWEDGDPTKNEELICGDCVALAVMERLRGKPVNEFKQETDSHE